MNTNIKKKTMLAVIKQEAYKYHKEPFKLSSGGTSNHYIDMRQVLMVPSWANIMTTLLLDEITMRYGNISYDGVAGKTMGADPLVYSSAYNHSLTPLIVRKEEKSYGTGGSIVGRTDLITKGAIVVDDVLTTGSAVCKTVSALMSIEIPVRAIAVIVDRREDPKRKIHGISDRPFVSLFTLNDVVNG